MKKKLVSLMLVAAMTASLTACGSKKTEEPTSTVHNMMLLLHQMQQFIKKHLQCLSTKEFR